MRAVTVFVIAFCFTYWLVVSITTSFVQESEMDRFDRACTERGGFVVEMPSGFWTDRYDCVKDNEVIYLPGFA